MKAKHWIWAAICLLVIGTLLPALNGDGAQSANGLIGGVGALLVVLTVLGATRAVKFFYGKLK